MAVLTILSGGTPTRRPWAAVCWQARRLTRDNSLWSLSTSPTLTQAPTAPSSSAPLPSHHLTRPAHNPCRSTDATRFPCSHLSPTLTRQACRPALPSTQPQSWQPKHNRNRKSNPSPNPKQRSVRTSRLPTSNDCAPRPSIPTFDRRDDFVYPRPPRSGRHCSRRRARSLMKDRDGVSDDSCSGGIGYPRCDKPCLIPASEVSSSHCVPIWLRGGMGRQEG